MRNWFSKKVATEIGEKDVVQTPDESKEVTESRWTTYSNLLRKRFTKTEPKVEEEPVVEEPKVVSKIQQSKDLVKYYYGLLLIQLVALKNLLLMSLERSNAALKSSSQKLKTLISRKPVVENIPPVEEEIKKEKEEKKEEPTETRKPSIVETLMTTLKLKKVEPEVEPEPEPVKPATRKEVIQAKMMKATVSVKYVFGLMVTQLVLLRNILVEYALKTKTVVTEKTSKTVTTVMNSQFASKLKTLVPKKQLSTVVEETDESKTNFVQNVLKYCGVRI